MHQYNRIRNISSFLLIWLILNGAAFSSGQTKDRSLTTKKQNYVLAKDKVGLRLDNFLSRAEKFGYQGIVLAAKNGQVILKKAYGLADRENGTRMTVSTRFPIASEEKIFTAAAILKLEEQGKLKVSDSIAQYFDNVPEAKKAITIHHLLTHSAGLPAYSGKDDELISRDELVKRMMTVKLRSKPGETYFYSNPSYSLLAVIIEKVSGKTFDEFVQKELFARAGMTETGYQTAQPQTKKRLCKYLAMETKCRDVSEKNLLPDGPSWTVRGNGAMFSTVEDLYKWHLALQNRSVLSQTSLDKINFPHLPSGAKTHIGYGWFVSNTERERAAFMSGGDQINAAYYWRSLDNETVVIQFTNNSWGPSRRINSVIPEIVSGSVPPILPAARITLTNRDLQRYAGTYGLPSGREFSVVLKNDQLAIAGSQPEIAGLLIPTPKSLNQKLLANIETSLSNIINGLANNNLEPIRKTHWRSEKFEEEKAYWTPAWKEWTDQWGKFVNSELIATIPTGEAKTRILNNYVLLHFQNGARLVNFKQNTDGYFYGDTSTTDFLPAYFQFVPLTYKKFVTYNFHLKSESWINFRIGKNKLVTGLIFSNGKEQVLATRIR